MPSFHSLLRFTVIQRVVKFKSPVICSKRLLLSPAYTCNAAWETQRQSPALKDLDVYEFINEIQRQAQRGHPLSAVDVDVMLNCVNHAEQFDEAVNILYKFRHGANAANMLASTHGAFVRSCLRFGTDETLLRVLDDPINYGVFLDAHDANTLMDHFLKNGNHRDAAKVASKIMLQEDFQNKLTCWLAAFSCLKWIKEPVPDTSADAVEGGGVDDDEEILLRLPFLKNPYFDDHFDISEFPALVGKTLAWTAGQLDNKEIATNLALLGYGLKKDYKNVSSILRHQLQLRTKLYEAVEQRLISNEASSDNSGEKTDGASKEPAPAESSVELEEIKTIIDQFHQSGLIIQEDLEENVLEELNKLLPDLEGKDIKERMVTLEKWDKSRQQRIENQVLRYLKTERMKEIDQVRQEMKQMEEYLNFFDNRTKLETSVHPELLKQEEEAKQKAQAEKQQLPSDDKYVIPELKVRREDDRVEF